MGFSHMRLHKPQSADVSLYTQHYEQGQDNPQKYTGQACEQHKYIIIGKHAMKPAALESLYEKYRVLFNNSVVNVMLKFIYIFNK